MTDKMNLNAIKHYLQGCNGTDGYYFNKLNRNSVYTDGMKYYFDKAGAWWLYDIIQTEVFDALKKLDTPDKYYLTFTVKDSTGKLKLEDYRGNTLFKKEIPLTDAPQGEIIFYCGWDGKRLITCVPSED